MSQLDLNQAAALVGQKISYPVGQFNLEFRILNVKQSFGVIRYEVEPIAGTGKQWINANKARFTGEQ